MTRLWSQRVRRQLHVGHCGRRLCISPSDGFQYDQNRTNYSQPVSVDVGALGIAVPAAGTHVEFLFDNNDRNLQLLLPLELRLECSGPCTSPPPPPPRHRLVFGAPSIMSGPECPTSQGGGPFWDRLSALSETHALFQDLVGSSDGGLTWKNLSSVFAGDGCTQCDGKMGGRVVQLGGGAGFRTLGNLNESSHNGSGLTGLASASSRATSVPTQASRESSLGRWPRACPTSRCSCRSTSSSSPTAACWASARAYRRRERAALGCGVPCDGWRLQLDVASVVASAEEVPYASEGPSEGALATLRNGTVMAVMRVDGQSGHYAPYVSKLSDDGGLSWRSLRPLHGGGSGGVDGAGCVRPRLMALGSRSLILSGGRPNPLSRDVLVWLNSEGDGEIGSRTRSATGTTPARPTRTGPSHPTSPTTRAPSPGRQRATRRSCAPATRRATSSTGWACGASRFPSGSNEFGVNLCRSRCRGGRAREGGAGQRRDNALGVASVYSFTSVDPGTSAVRKGTLY